MKKIIISLITLATLATANAQTTNISLLKDINPSGASTGGNRNYTVYNNKMYFVANDGVTGGELWVTDGTTVGTHIVKDINAGATGSYPDYIVVCNGKLYFNANDGIHGTELWTSDGTSAGTQLLKDILVGYNDSYPVELTVLNNKLYFSANDSVHAIEPWVSDGTAAGTQLLADINQDPSYQNSDPRYFTAYNNKLYFQANDQINADELWVTDGTTAGTYMLKDINSGSAPSSPMSFCVFNNKLYFKADLGNTFNEGELWVTDGTASGTVLVKNIYPAYNAAIDHMTVYNGSLYFTATDGVNGYELWKSDGTAAGTQLFKDINPGSGGSYCEAFTVFNNKLYFSSNDGTNGTDMWQSDGTAIGTIPFLDNNSNIVSSPAYFTVFGSRLYFRATAGNSMGDQLFSTTGTSASTQSLAPMGANSYALLCTAQIQTFNNSVYFNADYDTRSCEVWKLDTLASTGIKALSDNKYQVTVYPNPSTNIIHIQINENENTSIELYNTIGQKIFAQKLQAHETELNIGDLSSGIYTAQIIKDNQPVYQIKLIKL